jgi:hypothetical protein
MDRKNEKERRGKSLQRRRKVARGVHVLAERLESMVYGQEYAAITMRL